MTMQTIVRDEVRDQLEQIHKMQVGTEEYKLAVDGVTKLMDRAIEMEKLDFEHEEQVRTREFEEDLKVRQMKDEKNDRRVKNVLTGLGIGIPAVITVWGAMKSWEFEKEGVVTSLIGKGFMNKLLLKK